MKNMQNCELRKYQEEGVARVLSFLQNRRAALLADEPGLGKTIQTIEVINRLRPDSVLVVCPASLRLNWGRELERWLRVDVPITVLSYEATRSEEFPRAFGLVVFDEAHYLKNPRAQRTVACLKIPAAFRLFLTGTPIVNRPMDLYPILKAMGSRMDRVSYGKRYCGGKLKQIGWRPRRFAWDFTGASNLNELHDTLSRSVMVRRTKAEVLRELPAKTRDVIAFESRENGETPELMAAWQAAWDHAKGMWEDVVLPFEALAKCRQDIGLAKVPHVVAMARTLLEEGPLVIFAHHREVIARIHKMLSGSVVLHGGMSDVRKQAAVDEFQSGGSECFIGQIEAAGTGITLTRASTVLFAELDWVPGNMTQAEDRCHRIGQRNTVRVFHVVVKGGVDERIASALIYKQTVIDAVTK